MRDVPVRPLPIEALAPVIGAGRVAETLTALESAREALGGRTVWTMNSTAAGGGVAEMLVRILGYTGGAGGQRRHQRSSLAGGTSRFP